MNEKTENMQDLSEENIENVAGGALSAQKFIDRNVAIFPWEDWHKSHVRECTCVKCGEKYNYLPAPNKIATERDAYKKTLCPICLNEFTKGWPKHML